MIDCINITMKSFQVWLEEKQEDYIYDAILGVFGGGDMLGDQEKKHLLGRNTNEFSNNILNKFLNLGLLKSQFESLPNKYIDIKNMVERGILIKDLIDKVRGDNLAPNADLK
jgi:hypothetical protein